MHFRHRDFNLIFKNLSRPTELDPMTHYLTFVVAEAKIRQDFFFFTLSMQRSKLQREPKVLKKKKRKRRREGGKKEGRKEGRKGGRKGSRSDYQEGAGEWAGGDPRPPPHPPFPPDPQPPSPVRAAAREAGPTS